MIAEGQPRGAASRLLAALAARAMVLTAASGGLGYDAPPGALTPALLAAMRAHKADLLALVQDQEAGAGDVPADRGADPAPEDLDPTTGYHPAFPPTRSHPAFPPVPVVQTGTPAERVLAVLERWAPPEGWRLDRLAYRAGLSPAAARVGVRALRAERRIGLDEQRCRDGEGSSRTPIVLIRLRAARG